MRARACTLVMLLAGCADREYDEFDCDKAPQSDICHAMPPPMQPIRCGNGVLDEGEQCDAKIPSAPPPEPQCGYNCQLYSEPRASVSWEFALEWGTPESAPCLVGPPAYPPVNLHVQELDDAGVPVGDEIVETRQCYAGPQTIVLPRFSRYNLWADSTTDERTYRALTVPVDARAEIFVAADMRIYLDAGYPHITWTITDPQNAPLDCAQAGVANVVVVINNVEQSAACVDGAMVFRQFRFGTVHGSALLMGPMNEIVGTGGPISVTITEPNGLHPAHVTFVVSP